MLYNAAQTWERLLEISYDITFGKKKMLHTLHLEFHEDEFYHLSGRQYLIDVEPKFRGKKGKFLLDVLSGEITDEGLRKSAKWEDVQGRLSALEQLENILDSDFELYIFDAQKLRPHYCRITASYLIRNPQSGDVVFLFLGGTAQSLFCQSVFKEKNIDYSKSQTRLKVLKKQKTVRGITRILLNNIRE